MDIKYIIENLDGLMIYFIPASIFVMAYHLTARYSLKKSLFSANTVIGSYVIVSGLKWVYPQISSVMIIIISFVSGFLVGIIRNSRLTAFVMDKMFYKTLDEDVWYAISDFKKGTILRVYLNNSPVSYRGYFTEDHKSEDGHRWILLTNYKKYNGSEEHEDEPILDYKQDDTRKILLDTTNISRVEIKYPTGSSKI